MLASVAVWMSVCARVSVNVAPLGDFQASDVKAGECPPQARLVITVPSPIITSASTSSTIFIILTRPPSPPLPLLRMSVTRLCSCPNSNRQLICFFFLSSFFVLCFLILDLFILFSTSVGVHPVALIYAVFYECMRIKTQHVIKKTFSFPLCHADLILFFPHYLFFTFLF